MGRIEYEYPLFKVYYSNNSNNSNIRGNPGQQVSYYLKQLQRCKWWRSEYKVELRSIKTVLAVQSFG